MVSAHPGTIFRHRPGTVHQQARQAMRDNALETKYTRPLCWYPSVFFLSILTFFHGSVMITPFCLFFCFFALFFAPFYRFGAFFWRAAPF